MLAEIEQSAIGAGQKEIVRVHKCSVCNTLERVKNGRRQDLRPYVHMVNCVVVIMRIDVIRDRLSSALIEQAIFSSPQFVHFINLATAEPDGLDTQLFKFAGIPLVARDERHFVTHLFEVARRK